MTNEKRAHHLANNYAPNERLTLEGAILDALDQASNAGLRQGLKLAAEAAEAYWKDGKNVYARHAGWAVETRIRALSDPLVES